MEGKAACEEVFYDKRHMLRRAIHKVKLQEKNVLLRETPTKEGTVHMVYSVFYCTCIDVFFLLLLTTFQLSVYCPTKERLFSNFLIF